MHWTGSTAYLSHRKRTSKFEDRLRLFSLSNRRKSNEERLAVDFLPGGSRMTYADERKKNCQPNIVHQKSVSFRRGGKIKIFPDKQKLTEHSPDLLCKKK